MPKSNVRCNGSAKSADIGSILLDPFRWNPPENARDAKALRFRPSREPGATKNSDHRYMVDEKRQSCFYSPTCLSIPMAPEILISYRAYGKIFKKDLPSFFNC